MVQLKRGLPRTLIGKHSTTARHNIIITQNVLQHTSFVLNLTQHQTRKNASSGSRRRHSFFFQHENGRKFCTYKREESRMQALRSVTVFARSSAMRNPAGSPFLKEVNISISSSSTTARYLSSSPLDAFRDPIDRQTRGSEPVGRPWSVKELRRKSYEDLHKLWYVLYKERNMLLTEQQLSRTRQIIFPQPERFEKVKKSMGAIKQVLGERKRVKIAEFQQSKMEEEMTANAADDVDVEIDTKQR
eukprot:scaffold73_cov118-Cylindrotheca_fusiformis.AAC.2